MKRNQLCLFTLLFSFAALFSTGCQRSETSAKNAEEKETPLPSVVEKMENGERVFSNNPAIKREENQFIDPGAMVCLDGVFYDFFNAIAKGPVYIGCARSKNGTDWEILKGENDPLFTRKSFEGIMERLPQSVHMKSVLFVDNQWIAYLTAVSSGNTSPFYGEIYRATASSPEGPWTIDSEPVLTRGDWEEGRVGLPEVIRLENGDFVMFYSVEDGSFGRADSKDGIKFTKHPESLGYADKPAFLKTEEGFLMFAGEQISFSEDGKKWQNNLSTIYRQDELSERNIPTTWIGDAVSVDGEIQFFLEAGNNTTGSNIYLISWKL